MSDLFGNHIVGFPTRRLIYVLSHYLNWPFAFYLVIYLGGYMKHFLSAI